MLYPTVRLCPPEEGMPLLPTQSHMAWWVSNMNVEESVFVCLFVF